MTRRRPPAPPDQAARDRIVADLDTCLLVEAGAGSGKTKSLVDRMLALVNRGEAVETLAAVTFTRKAAAELRERFQVALEGGLVAARDAADDQAWRRYDMALRGLDGAFLGTIHAFCARLLREHPFEAGLDPAFRELTEPEFEQAQRVFWERWLERAVRDDDPGFQALEAAGVRARDLFRAFRDLCEFPDVTFPASEAAAPDVDQCRAYLVHLLAQGRALMPADEHLDGWDDLQRLVLRLSFLERACDWSQPARFLAALEEVKARKPTQKRWSDDPARKREVKDFGEQWAAFVEAEAAPLRRRWQEHRYVLVLGFLRPAVAAFERERVDGGRLSFTDLLLQTARMLRTSARARRELGRRYARLLVDEFQDTDPVQAEVCLLLGSDPGEGDDWRAVVPRPGALFVVGDPKQSIYRFRRADIETYELVKRRFEHFGGSLTLTANFRSVPGVATLVNRHFREAFPEASTPRQAAFSPLEAMRKPGPAPAVRYYRRGGRNVGEILAADAAAVASWVARRVAAGERRPGDFLILVYRRNQVDPYVSALAVRNVPAIAAGGQLEAERELRELKLVLEALADPDNPVAVLAALNGLFFGLSPADLLAGVTAGERLSIAGEPQDPSTPLGHALHRLHQWSRVAADEPADQLLERILDDTGLLALAASADQGNSRAGILLYLVDAIRATDVPAGITQAIQLIADTLDRSEAAPALDPGRSDVVRVMNLHKAKGLEAPVVILAAPTRPRGSNPDLHVRRGARGGAEGGIRVRDPAGPDNPWQKEVPAIALPVHWEEWEGAERDMLDAEWDRLLYVAATRARDELVVALGDGTREGIGGPEKETTWSRLTEALVETGEPLDLPVDTPPGRHRLTETAASVRTREVEADGRRRAAGEPSTRFTTVSEAARSEFRFVREFDRTAREEDAADPGRGRAWGRAVHRALEAAGRGRTGDNLRQFVAAVISEEYAGRPGEERQRLTGLLADCVAATVVGQPALFAAGDRWFEWPVAAARREGGATTVVEGVLDAACRDGTGWTVLDWKTDGDRSWAARQQEYRRQVETYAAIVGGLAGAEASATLVRIAAAGTLDDGPEAPPPGQLSLF